MTLNRLNAKCTIRYMLLITLQQLRVHLIKLALKASRHRVSSAPATVMNCGLIDHCIDGPAARLIANAHDSLPVHYVEEKGFRDLMAFLKPNHCCGAN